MNDRIKKMMEMKGKGREMSPMEQKAKLDVLKQLMGTVQGAMGENLKGLKKVTVAAPDKSGLEEGLAKAKDLMQGHEGDMMDEEGSEEEMHESPEAESAEDMMASHDEPEHDEAEMSDEDIDAQIKKLMLKKEMKNKGMGV